MRPMCMYGDLIGSYHKHHSMHIKIFLSILQVNISHSNVYFFRFTEFIDGTSSTQNRSNWDDIIQMLLFIIQIFYIHKASITNSFDVSCPHYLRVSWFLGLWLIVSTFYKWIFLSIWIPIQNKIEQFKWRAVFLDLSARITSNLLLFI